APGRARFNAARKVTGRNDACRGSAHDRLFRRREEGGRGRRRDSRRDGRGRRDDGRGRRRAEELVASAAAAQGSCRERGRGAAHQTPAQQLPPCQPHGDRPRAVCFGPTIAKVCMVTNVSARVAKFQAFFVRSVRQSSRAGHAAETIAAQLFLRGRSSRSGGGESGSFQTMYGFSFSSWYAFAASMAALNAASNALKSFLLIASCKGFQFSSMNWFKASSCFGRVKAPSSI